VSLKYSKYSAQTDRVELVLEKEGSVTIAAEPLGGSCEAGGEAKETITVKRTTKTVSATFDPLPEDGCYLPGQEVTVKLENDTPWDEKNRRRSKVRIVGDVAEVVESSPFANKTEVKVKVARTQSTDGPKAVIKVEAANDDCTITEGQSFDLKVFKVRVKSLKPAQPSDGYVADTKVTVQLAIDPPLPKGSEKVYVKVRGEPAGALDESQNITLSPKKSSAEAHITVGTEDGKIVLEPWVDFLQVADPDVSTDLKVRLPKFSITDETKTTVKRGSSLKIYLRLTPPHPHKEAQGLELKAFGKTAEVSLYQNTSKTMKIEEKHPAGEHTIRLIPTSEVVDQEEVTFKVTVKER
jgi:hypothetical protein